MLTPKARGALSAALFETMRSGDPQVVEQTPESAEDAAIALWALFELHYRGFDDVDDELEWHPALLTVRHRLASDLERRLRERWEPYAVTGRSAAEIGTELFAYIEGHDGPSVARAVHTTAEAEQVLDLLRWRSVYHLKEADPTAWVVPRLGARPKAALMELQFDEYGDGDPNRLHSHLFARGLEAIGLRAEYGAYVDDAITENLEMNNAGSMFGLHRRLRGAAMGHLAAFEMTSSLPSRKMVQGLERLELDGPMSAYYDEHVEADAIHEHLAARDICGTLAEDEPDQLPEILFGAFTCLDVEARFATAMLTSWGVGR